MISVVIPCYGQAQYLAETIESCLSQTIVPEIIVVNDGSMDNAKGVAGKYPVKVINQVNKGLASARNTGIMNAKGDYILFLDADDLLLPSVIEKMQKGIEEMSADIIAPEFHTFGISESTFKYGEVPTLEMFRTGNRLPYFCAIRKDALLECGGYQPKMTHGYEDLHLWFDLLSRGKKIHLIREPLVLYRVKEHSMIHDAQAHHEELMKQIQHDFPA